MQQLAPKRESGKREQGGQVDRIEQRNIGQRIGDALCDKAGGQRADVDQHGEYGRTVEPIGLCIGIERP